MAQNVPSLNKPSIAMVARASVLPTTIICMHLTFPKHSTSLATHHGPTAPATLALSSHRRWLISLWPRFLTGGLSSLMAVLAMFSTNPFQMIPWNMTVPPTIGPFLPSAGWPWYRGVSIRLLMTFKAKCTSGVVWGCSTLFTFRLACWRVEVIDSAVANTSVVHSVCDVYSDQYTYNGPSIYYNTFVVLDTTVWDVIPVMEYEQFCSSANLWGKRLPIMHYSFFFFFF